MLRSLLIVTALALTTGACTIHRHYHQGPATPGAYDADGEPGYAQAATPQQPEGPPGQYPGADRGDQPIAPEYARPAPTPRYDDYSNRYDGRYDNRIDDGYRTERRYDSRRYQQRCDCSHPSHRVRRPRRSRGYPIGPVVPDNPVEWLE